jgi:hypothetical protein
MLVLSRPSLADALIERLSGGGDARIAPDPVSGLNCYLSAPRPRDLPAFVSSTANDLSAGVWDYLSRSFLDAGGRRDGPHRAGPARAARQSAGGMTLRDRPANLANARVWDQTGFPVVQERRSIAP